jgi:catechol 2,3-dioxygenase-like lactoylglutathione lyase family enzyme
MTEGANVELKLELVLIPVSDVDRAKAFYVERCGFHLDVDTTPGHGIRVVQLTPPGSACSITIGTGLTTAEPGTYLGTHLVVYDIDAAREELVARGVEVGEVRHYDRDAGEWRPGSHPEHDDYASFAEFADPDGNTWVLQEVRRDTA